MKNSSSVLAVFLVLPLLLIVLLTFQACKHETFLAGVAEVCFERNVLPVFQTSCGLSGCHDASAAGGYTLNSYSGILAAIEPGSPDKSEVYKSITNIWSDEMMPPSQPLSADNRMLIRIWIE